MSRRTRSYDVSGNVVWLTPPAGNRRLRNVDLLATLGSSLARLAGEVRRSERLKADIAAAVDARRYELFRRAASLGPRASTRSLAAAQRSHVGSLLQFIHAIAAAGSEPRAGELRAPTRIAPLARSIRELEASVERAGQASRAVLQQCQVPDWREGIAAANRGHWPF